MRFRTFEYVRTLRTFGTHKTFLTFETFRTSLLLTLSLLVLPEFVSAQRAVTPRSDTTSIAPKEVIVTGFPITEGQTPAATDQISRLVIKELQTENDVPKLAALSPSAFYYSESGTDIGYTHLSLRGFDQTRVSVMVNGIPQNGAEDHEVYWIDIPDLSVSASSIDLQRGAGSAFYGPPAIGGSVNVETQPSATRALQFTAGYGDFNTHKYAVTANSGLFDDKYEVYAHLSQTHTDGFRDRDVMDLTSYFVSVARYDSNFTLQANFYGGPFSDGLAYYGLTKNQLNSADSFRFNPSEPRTYERRPDEGEQFSQPHYELLSELRLSPSVTLSNTIYYIQGDGYFDIDGTWASPSFFRITPAYAARYGFSPIQDDNANFQHELYRGFVDDKDWGWLPRVDITHDGGVLTLAADLRTHSSLHWGQLLSASELPADLPGDYHFYEFNGGKDIANVSLMDQLNPTNAIHLLASLQMVNERYKFSNEKPLYVDSSMAADRGIDSGWTSYAFTVPLTFFNPRLGVSVDLAQGVSSFASVSYTTREPRLIDYYNGEFMADPNFAIVNHAYDFSQPLVKPEHLLDLELGAGWDHAPLSDDFALTLKATAYYMAFHDELIATDSVDHFGNPFERNATRTRHEGLELSAKLDYTELCSFAANLTMSSNTIEEVDPAFLPTEAVGKTPPGFSPVLGNLILSVKPSPELGIDLMGRYVGRMFGDVQNSNDLENDAYMIMDGLLTFHFPSFAGIQSLDAKLAVNNIFDKRYAAFVTGEGFFVGAPRHFYGSITLGI